MKVWLTTVGTSPFAVVNTLWAACKDKEENYVPERIYLIKNEIVERGGHVAKVKKWIEKIVTEFGVEEVEIKEENANEEEFKTFAKTIGNIVKKEKEEGNEIAVDMTPGRKFMSAFVMYLGIGEGVDPKADRVYYLHLTDMSYKDKPYIEIPMPKQKLYEVRNYLLGRWNDTR